MKTYKNNNYESFEFKVRLKYFPFKKKVQTYTYMYTLYSPKHCWCVYCMRILNGIRGNFELLRVLCLQVSQAVRPTCSSFYVFLFKILFSE